MHLPSEFMVARMGLAEFGMWAVPVNDEKELVLVIKLSTDVLKWISRAVKVNVLVGHGFVEGKCIRVIGLEIFDCQTNPLRPNLPQVESWEIESFDELLKRDQFRVHFHNEQPFLSVLDANGSLPTEAVNHYIEQRKEVTIEQRKEVTFHNSPVVTPPFRTAQDLFEASLLEEREGRTPSMSIQRWPLALADFSWNSTAVPEAGSFTPDDPDEGGSFEDLVMHVMQPNFPGKVIASPKIPDGDNLRELCDVLALDKNAFLFEAKAFSVFEKDLNQSSERKAKTVMKHFEKALGQLQGAVRRLKEGVDIVSADGARTPVKASSFSALHGIVTVSNSNFDLPWDRIGARLAEAQDPPKSYFHLLDLTELQRTMAFSASSNTDLSQILIRRAEVVTSSKNARISTEFVPRHPTTVSIPPAEQEALGFSFVWAGEGCADSLPQMFQLVYSQLAERQFSGRIDFHIKVGRVRGTPGLGIGLLINCASGSIDDMWWQEFTRGLLAAFSERHMPEPVAKSCSIRRAAEIRKRFPELALAVEFESGHIIAKKDFE